MRTVQGVALDGLRARVRALAARTLLPVRPSGAPVRSASGDARVTGAPATRPRTERAGRSPRPEAPLADRGPAVRGSGVRAPARRTALKESFRHAAADPRTAALSALGSVLRGFVRPGSRRPGAVRASAAALRALRARHGDAPALVRTRSGRTVLVLLDPEDLRRFYAEPVSVLAADQPEKCRGPMEPEPAGSGCSRGELRSERRQISAAVLGAALPVHPSYGPYLAAVAEEAGELTATGTLALARARRAVNRAARRIVLGDAAAADEELTGWLTQLRAEGKNTRSRLYPVVPELMRVTRTETEWRGVRYPAGTSVLLPAAFHQRDPERVPAAHVFVPGRWKNPGADQDIRMAPFSHGGGRCPGDQLGLMITAALCAEVLWSHRVAGARPALDPVGPLPATLDPHGIRLTLTRR